MRSFSDELVTRSDLPKKSINFMVIFQIIDILLLLYIAFVVSCPVARTKLDSTVSDVARSVDGSVVQQAVSETTEAIKTLIP